MDISFIGNMYDTRILFDYVKKINEKDIHNFWALGFYWHSFKKKTSTT